MVKVKPTVLIAAKTGKCQLACIGYKCYLEGQNYFHALKQTRTRLLLDLNACGSLATGSHTASYQATHPSMLQRLVCVRVGNICTTGSECNSTSDG